MPYNWSLPVQFFLFYLFDNGFSWQFAARCIHYPSLCSLCPLWLVLRKMRDDVAADGFDGRQDVRPQRRPEAHVAQA